MPGARPSAGEGPSRRRAHLRRTGRTRAHRRGRRASHRRRPARRAGRTHHAGGTGLHHAGGWTACVRRDGEGRGRERTTSDLASVPRGKATKRAERMARPLGRRARERSGGPRAPETLLGGPGGPGGPRGGPAGGCIAEFAARAAPVGCGRRSMPRQRIQQNSGFPQAAPNGRLQTESHTKSRIEMGRCANRAAPTSQQVSGIRGRLRETPTLVVRARQSRPRPAFPETDHVVARGVANRLVCVARRPAGRRRRVVVPSRPRRIRRGRRFGRRRRRVGREARRRRDRPRPPPLGRDPHGRRRRRPPRVRRPPRRPPRPPRRVPWRDRGSRRRSGRRRRRRRGPRRGRRLGVHHRRRARRGARRVRARAFLGPDPMVRRRGAPQTSRDGSRARTRVFPPGRARRGRRLPRSTRPPSLDFGASPRTTPRDSSPNPSRGPSPTSSPRPTPDDSFSDVAISTTASPSPRGNPSSSTEASAPKNPSRSRTSSRGLDRRDTSSRTFPRDARSPSIRRIRRMKRRARGTPPSTLARCSVASSGVRRSARGTPLGIRVWRPGRRRSRRRWRLAWRRSRRTPRGRCGLRWR